LHTRSNAQALVHHRATWKTNALADSALLQAIDTYLKTGEK
jgi:hypothetical protein